MGGPLARVLARVVVCCAVIVLPALALAPSDTTLAPHAPVAPPPPSIATVWSDPAYPAARPATSPVDNAVAAGALAAEVVARPANSPVDSAITAGARATEVVARPADQAPADKLGAAAAGALKVECTTAIHAAVCAERANCLWDAATSSCSQKKAAHEGDLDAGAPSCSATGTFMGCGPLLDCEWRGEWGEGVCAAALPENRVKPASADAPIAWTTGIGGLHKMVINMDDRPDRLASFLDAMATIGVNKTDITRIPGVTFMKEQGSEAYDPKAAAVDGCTNAHLNALKHAMAQGWDRYACFEDDFILRQEFMASGRPVIDSLINDALTDLDNSVQGWDVLYLSGRINMWIKSERVSKVIDSTAASGYIVNKRFYQKWKQTLSDHLNAHPKHDLWQPLDLMWKPLQSEHGFWVLNRRIGRQAAGESDLENQFTDYGDESAALHAL